MAKAIDTVRQPAKRDQRLLTTKKAGDTSVRKWLRDGMNTGEWEEKVQRNKEIGLDTWLSLSWREQS